MPTPNFNLPLYGPGDTAALDTLLNGQSNALDTALLGAVGNIGQGTTAARDTRFGSPGTDAARVALANRKVAWYNLDRGWWESYYAVSGLSGLTAVGLVSGTASGWYPIGDGPAISLVPAGSQTLGPGSTFTNWNAPGSGASWRRGGTNYFSYASGVITCTVAGRYDFSAGLAVQTGAGDTVQYVLRNNSTVSPNIVSVGVLPLSGSAYNSKIMTGLDLIMNAGDNLRVHNILGGPVAFAPTGDGQSRVMGEFTVKYASPLLVSE